MKVSEQFKSTIKAYLDNMAAVDSLFAPVYQKPTKNIDNCITYILNQVKKSGCCGFSDDEIFGMALHYPSVKLEVQHLCPILRPFRYAPRTEDGAGSKAMSHPAIQKKQKGDRRLPRINYFCIAIMYKHLTREQRYAIYLGRQKGETLEIIARSIGVDRSTVSRELKRNSTANGKYVWLKAHEMSEARQKRCLCCEACLYFIMMHGYMEVLWNCVSGMCIMTVFMIFARRLSIRE